ncbi:subtilisin-like protease [Beauveria brongniartii RCEF 3172]|uniref:Subtilisin-like protease n=1 Tax=Beauveria brongniartii RCEF 3172 TaxID=1081107 RepID=A0A167B348_9HYPO|nr:subtilisin-like protease [Beauveria brongniartii RCEF 3172]
MVRPLLSTLVWLAAVSSTLAATDQPPTWNGGKTIANAFIIEGKSIQEVEALAKTIQEVGGEVLNKFDSPFFYGLSVGSFPNDIDIEALAAGFNIWPEEEIGREIGEESDGQAEQDQPRDSLGEHESRATKDTLWHLVMTQVDKMHAAGFKGEGIKVAIVDTGVDYTHEALGGCFGPGCKVAFGDNFADDGKKGDPKDCQGHGTAVAGMVGGYSEAANYVGAAPNATLMAYRVLDCNHTGTYRSAMDGWLRAEKDGAHIIVSSTGVTDNWAQNPLSIAMARIAASGVVCFNSAGNSVKKGPFNIVSPGTGRGVLSVSTFSEQFIGDDYASLGPTWDLDIKPSLGAPGLLVPAIEMGNKYTTVSGTSFAAPFAAGIGALVADALGTSSGSKGSLKINADMIRSRLMSTAKPQKAFRANGLISVIQQGGGLIDAWDAAHTTTLVEPPSLAFNDTEHRVPSLSLKITNMAKSEVTYQLSSLHAPTINTVAENTLINPDPMVTEPVNNAPADIKISQDSLTLGPGLSATVQVTAADPSGLDPARIPVWSGWIVVNGTDGSNLTVPFLGVAGSLRPLNTLYNAFPELKIAGPKPDDDPVRAGTTKFLFKNPEQGQRPGLSGSIAQQDAGKKVSSILVGTYLPFGSPMLRFDIVPLDICSPSPASNSGTGTGSALSENCVPSGNLTEYGGVKSIGQPRGSPVSYVERHTEFKDVDVSWDGSFKPGQDATAGEIRYAPPGRYQLAVHVLVHFGDAANPSDWQTFTSNEFSIAYEHNIASKAAPSP